MKNLMIVMMTLLMASVASAGECKLNESCESEKACKALSDSYAFKDGKCVNPASAETAAKCADLDASGRTTAAKSQAGDAVKDGPATADKK